MKSKSCKKNCIKTCYYFSQKCDLFKQENVRRRGWQPRAAPGLVVGRHWFDELPESAIAAAVTAPAAAADPRRAVAAVRPRVDSREVDVGVDGTQRGAQRGEYDQDDKSDRDHCLRRAAAGRMMGSNWHISRHR